MIGDMKHRVTIQEPVLTPDGGGGFTQSWQDVAENPVVYAAIASLSTGAQLRFSQMQATVTHRIVLRWRADITTAMRLVKDGASYNITSLSDRDGEGVYLEILAATAT